MRAVILCDIDGVLADCRHRLQYKESGNYDAFYGTAILDDEPIAAGIQLIESLDKSAGYSSLHFVTGRPKRTRKMTELWLCYYAPKLAGLLQMREDGDYRAAPIVKVELVQQIWERWHIDGGDQVYFIDDDPENVKAVCAAFPQITGITFGVGRM